MKRTFKRPDGTEETLEGTAEELAEYERKLNESQGKVPKPGILKGKELGGIAARLRRLQESIDHLDARGAPYWPPAPIWIVSCSVCGRVGCNGYHGFRLAQHLYVGPTGPVVTITTTSDAIRMTEQPTLDVGHLTTCLGSLSS